MAPVLHRSFHPRRRPLRRSSHPGRYAVSPHASLAKLHRSIYHGRRCCITTFVVVVTHSVATFAMAAGAALKHPVAGNVASHHPPWSLVLHRSFFRRRRSLRHSFRHGRRAALKHPSPMKQHGSGMCSDGASSAASGATMYRCRTDAVAAISKVGGSPCSDTALADGCKIEGENGTDVRCVEEILRVLTIQTSC
uniref:Predicted protein n=1 Tax=Hordeum vulgare subsp. vulgare TaxID=112509 RepID=F2CWW3_HORVV|nr:predicted protein [Hordeum vulgare subsp. vulgare]